jgi:hypothetical protein
MTNWDSYYKRPYPSAQISRRITASLLVRLIRRFASQPEACVMVELGGANSCFLSTLQARLHPREYHIVDNNRVGMELLGHPGRTEPGVVLHLQDVRSLEIDIAADVIFSVGLVEHFVEAELPAVVAAHFTNLKPGGIAIITFPTPTFLYRAARRISERLGMWIFLDEVPLPIPKMVSLASRYGELLHTRINWWILFTQGIVVIQKRASILP